MTDSFEYYYKLRDGPKDLTAKEHLKVFLHAVIEFSCFNKGQLAKHISNTVKKYDYDHEKAIAGFDIFFQDQVRGNFTVIFGRGTDDSH